MSIIYKAIYRWVLMTKSMYGWVLITKSIGIDEYKIDVSMIIISKSIRMKMLISDICCKCSNQPITNRFINSIWEKKYLQRGSNKFNTSEIRYVHTISITYNILFPSDLSAQEVAAYNEFVRGFYAFFARNDYIDFLQTFTYFSIILNC